MTPLPSWLETQLRCPQTGVKLVQETRDGRPVYVARPEGGEPRVYEIDNGVPVLLPRQ